MSLSNQWTKTLADLKHSLSHYAKLSQLGVVVDADIKAVAKATFDKECGKFQTFVVSYAGELRKHKHAVVLVDNWNKFVAEATSPNATSEGVTVSTMRFLDELDEAIAASTIWSNEMKSNTVTVTLGPGATFVGPVSAGENIRVSYQSASGVSKDELRLKLEELIRQVGSLTEIVESDESKNDISAQLAVLVGEVKKEKPSRAVLNSAASFLLEAAKTVASLAAPITTAVEAVLKLIAPK